MTDCDRLQRELTAQRDKTTTYEHAASRYWDQLQAIRATIPDPLPHKRKALRRALKRIRKAARP